MLTSAGIGYHAVRPKNGRLFPLILIPGHTKVAKIHIDVLKKEEYLTVF